MWLTLCLGSEPCSFTSPPLPSATQSCPLYRFFLLLSDIFSSPVRKQIQVPATLQRVTFSNELSEAIARFYHSLSPPLTPHFVTAPVLVRSRAGSEFFLPDLLCCFNPVDEAFVAASLLLQRPWPPCSQTSSSFSAPGTCFLVCLSRRSQP